MQQNDDRYFCPQAPCRHSRSSGQRISQFRYFDGFMGKTIANIDDKYQIYGQFSIIHTLGDRTQWAAIYLEIQYSRRPMLFVIHFARHASH